jgi:tetratricopeptide (TPR) repeat protein
MSAKPTQPRLQVGGTVDSRKHVYILRPSDDEVFDLLERGEYCNVLCSRQMGKSSLLHHAKMRLAEAGVKTALIDVSGYLGSVSTESVEAWYLNLLQEIADQLGLDLNVAGWWQTRTSATPNRRLIAFFRDEVAAKAGAPVVIILDEIDSTLKLPYTDDLFVALRAMYNDRPREAAFEQVAFCLVGAATPNELIKDPRTTPYNVGRMIELRDFDPVRHDLSPLHRAVSNTPQTGEALVCRVLHWTGGHPYLTIKLCDEVVKEGVVMVEGVDRLVDKLYRNLDAVRSDVHFATALRFFDPKSGRVNDLTTTLTLYCRIWRGQQELDLTTPVHIQLKLTGIVKRNDYGRLVVRNRIYQLIFTEDWARTAMGTRWNIPYPRNRYFTGRKTILTQLEAVLASDMPAALYQAIAGLGGVGKTQTAIEYAYRHRDQYRAVLWVRAGTETSLVSGYHELAEVLSLAVKDARDSTEVVAAVRRWLSREPGYLLILDNADNPALVKDYLPPDPKGHVLLTSRAQNFDVLGIRDPIELPILTPDEALGFLLKRTRRDKGPLDPAEQAAALALAGELGYLPLALEQAAAYMVEHEEAFYVYLDAYRKSRLELLDERGPVAGDYLETVRTTWKRNFEAVAAESPASIALLRLSAFFAPDTIPYELILEGASQLGSPLASALASPAGGDYALNKLLTPLARHSLVRRDPEPRTYSVPRLVQAVLLDELTAATRKDLAERAVKALNRTFPDVHYANWPRCERLVSHALAARGWIEREDLLVPAAAQLLNQAGYYLYVRARYAEAEPLYRRALAIDEAVLGCDHPETTQALNNLAVLLRTQGHLHGEAEYLARRALAIREAALGPDHPDTAISLINLALWFQARGRYAEAEPLCRRALAIREKVLGPDHPDTAQSLNDLAILFQVQGRLGEAEPLYRRALAIWEKAPGVGRDHPDTARGLDNLAYLHRAQGRLGEAEPLYRRALAIREKALGPDHPDTLMTRHSIAHWTGEAGDARAALRLYRELLPDRQRILGPDHPDTLATRHDIARWTGEAGDARAALRLYRELLPDQERVLGPDHPDTLLTRHEIARWTGEAGDAREALRLYRELLPDRQRVLGPDHPETLATRHSIARWTGEAGDAREALQLYRELLPDRRRVQGPEHPETLATRHDIARWTGEAGDAREALRLYRELLPDRQRVLGPDHPDTLTTQARAYASK